MSKTPFRLYLPFRLAFRARLHIPYTDVIATTLQAQAAHLASVGRCHIGNRAVRHRMTNFDSEKGTVFIRFPCFGVPGRTRTVDIENHKQSCECLINPVFIGVSAIFDFLFAAILRLFTQGPILFQ